MTGISIHSICVYCGSADGIHPDYLTAAKETGGLLARQGICIIFGGGKTGMMGALADGALQAGGEVIGLIPENLNTSQLVHTGLSRLEVLPDIQIRKARMSALADAFIALPGGFGTLDELFETLTWAQIGLHQKPIGLLNTRGYWSPLLKWVEHAKQEGFIYAEHQSLLISGSDPASLLDQLQHFETPAGLERWVKRED
jgi:uncharacterized protein (TIGR00730 family)